MKKRIAWLMFAFTALASVFLISGCNINNPIIDEWWEGETPNSAAPVIPITVYTVTFNMQDNKEYYFDAVNGNSQTIKPQPLKEGTLASEPGLVIWSSDGKKHDAADKFFAGWYTASGQRWYFSSTKVDSAADLSDGKTDGIIPLYTRWDSSGYTVIFEHGGDSIGITWDNTTYPPQPEYVASNVELSQPKGFGLKSNDPLASSYPFTGWYIDKNDSFVVDDGDEKWDFTKPVTGDMKLYAGWGAAKIINGVVPPSTPIHTVTFDDKDEDPNTSVLNEEVLDGKQVPRPDAIYRDGFAFGGWYITGTDTPWVFGNPVTDDITLDAKWEQDPPVEYTVDFDMQGGEYFDALKGNTTINPQRLTPSELVQEPGLVIWDVAIDDGHHDTPPTKFFGGWYTDTNTKWDFNTMTPNGDMTLYAKWSDSGCTVNFNPNGDFDKNGSISSDEIDFTKTVYTPEPEYVASGVILSQPKGFGLKPGPFADKYAFTGWYTDAACTAASKWDFNTSVTRDMTLYAGWGTKTPSGVITPENGGTPTPIYTVTFEENGADTSVSDEAVVTGYTVPQPDAIHKTDYVFTGWYKDSACTELWDFTTLVTETDDVYGRRGTDDNTFTLYAGWEPVPYTAAWFDEYYSVVNPKGSGKEYYPIQCDPGEADGYDVDDPADNSANDHYLVDMIIPMLKKYPNYIVQIIGYKDSPDDNRDTEREAATWWSLIQETGVNPEQIVMNTRLPPGATKESQDMIIAPNESSGVVGPDGDEVKIYIYVPTN